MKEFCADTGGRYAYNDDILNLQDLALAFGELFTECDNFVISGCVVNGQSVGSGYVYINGKIRHFNGSPNVASWPQFLYEYNYTEDTDYVSGVSKIARTVYSCKMASRVPGGVDQVTNQVRGTIRFTSAGPERTLKDAFFGKYALLKDPSGTTQTVNGDVVFAGIPRTETYYSAKAGLLIDNTSVTKMAKVISDSNGLEIQSYPRTGGNAGLVLKFLENDGFQFYKDGTLICTINSDAIVSNTTVRSNKMHAGGLAISNNHIYNYADATDGGMLMVNMVGLNGGRANYRNTVIGNGKNQAMLLASGAEDRISVFAGSTSLESENNVALKLVSKNAAYNNAIGWYSSSATNSIQGLVGYDEVSNDFKIMNNAGGILIVANNSTGVDIAPAIKENGMLLSDKYVLVGDYTTAINQLESTISANNDRYSTTFAQLDGGLFQFIGETYTARALRNQIGAIGNEELSRHPEKAQCFGDMPNDEQSKRTMCENIGALYKSDYLGSDTGWKTVQSGLYIRQVRNIVCVQGKLTTSPKNTVVFQIPNTISPPAHSVKKSIAFDNSRTWTVEITGGSRSCKVVQTDGNTGVETVFSLTYMA